MDTEKGLWERMRPRVIEEGELSNDFAKLSNDAFFKVGVPRKEILERLIDRYRNTYMDRVGYDPNSYEDFLRSLNQDYTDMTKEQADYIGIDQALRNQGFNID